MGLTVAVAPMWAAFMNTPELTPVLTLLAPVLLIRAASVTPRAVLIRQMRFRTIAIADVTAAVGGGALGVAVALLGEATGQSWRRSSRPTPCCWWC